MKDLLIECLKDILKIMQNDSIIYINGCSFTYGTDSGDFKLPSYRSDLDLTRIGALQSISSGTAGKITADYYDSIRNDLNQIIPGELVKTWAAAAIDHQRENRWSAVLGKTLNMPVINKSIPGVDNFSIALRTINDVKNLRQQGTDVKKIFVQFTCRTRYGFLVENWPIWNVDNYSLDTGESEFQLKKLDDEFGVRSLNAGMLSLPDSDITKEEKYFIENYHPDLLLEGSSARAHLVNYVIRLKMMKYFIERELESEVIFLDSWFLCSYAYLLGGNSYSLVEYLLTPDNNSFLGSTINDLFPRGVDSMFNMVNDEEISITGGFHYKDFVHKRFADYLANKYF